MRTCPKCKKTYDTTWTMCLNCGIPLEDDLDKRLTRLEEQAKKILDEVAAIRRGDLSQPAVMDTALKEEAAKPQAAVPAEDTETRIGKYLLNKIGVISVVAGVAFFIAYAFKNLTPFVRVCIGYAISAGMVMAGIALEKIKKYKWYGKGLLCGGWALAYFTAYAMYHIKAAQIISSRTLDLVLVSAVVIAMACHLFKYRSQGLVILSLMLGYITAGINQYAVSSFLYITILAVVACVFLIRMNWHGLAAFSLFGTYAAHFLWMRPHWNVRPTPEDFWVSSAFLVVYWALYNAASFFAIAKDERQRRSLDGFIVMNSFLFGLLCFWGVRAYDASLKLPFTGAAAGILIALAAIAYVVKGKGHLKTAYIIAAVSFLSVAVRFAFGKTPAYFVWFAEIPVLLAAGIYLDNPRYRIAAWGMSGIMLAAMAVYFGVAGQKILFVGKEMYLTLFLYLWGMIAFLAARYVYISKPEAAAIDDHEISLSNVYTILAGIVLILTAYYEVNTKLVTLTWALSALFLFIIGFFLKDKVFRYSAIGLVAVSLARCITVDLAGVNTGYRIMAFISFGSVLLAVSFWYSKMSLVYQNKGIAGKIGIKAASAVIIPCISLMVLAGAYLSPSEFRKQDALKDKEIEVTARFMAKNALSKDDAAFLRERKFSALEAAMRSLPLDKDGRNLDLYLRSMDMGVNSTDIFSRLAWYYNEKGDKAKAIGLYEKGIALDPGVTNWNTRSLLRSLAKLYRETGNYEKAAASYEKYLIYWKNTEDLYELAICYEKLGKYDQALAKLNEALKLDQRGTYSEEIVSLRSDIYGKKEVLEKKK